MLLSFIVPAYKVEKYIRKCLLSLLPQDLDPAQYEIIVVNDSSPDGSRAVAEAVAREHPQVRILDLVPNGGVGAARNLGLDNARGKYVMTVDPDDYLDPGVILPMIRLMEQERLDMLGFRYRGVTEQGEDWAMAADPHIAREGTVTGKEYLMYNEFPIMTHQYVYRREFLDGNRLRMMPRVRHEDDEFTPRAIALCRRIRHYPVKVYNYVQREGSTMATLGPQDVLDTVTGYASLVRFARNGQITDPELISLLEKRAHDMLRYMVRQNRKMGWIPEARLWRQIRKEGMIPLVFAGKRLKGVLVWLAPGLYGAWHRKK